MDLRDATAVVTGAASGIGRQLAQHIDRRGAQLTVAETSAASPCSQRSGPGPSDTAPTASRTGYLLNYRPRHRDAGFDLAE